MSDCLKCKLLKKEIMDLKNHFQLQTSFVPSFVPSLSSLSSSHSTIKCHLCHQSYLSDGNGDSNGSTCKGCMITQDLQKNKQSSIYGIASFRY